MSKKVMLLLFLALFVFNGVVFAETPQESFKKAYPNLSFEGMKETEIKGLYEVTSGLNIFYYHPKTGYLFYGEIRTKEGKNLTTERKLEIMSAKAKDLPLEQAVKIGSGKNTIIEFTDPDCPYCRKASEFFKKRDDITRYIFFYPLPFHPQAEDKAKYILCAKDKAKAYEEVMGGKIDGKKMDLCEDKTVTERLEKHKQTGVSVGVTGTPTLIVNGQLVVGANIPKIESLLSK